MGPLDDALGRIGDRWSLALVDALHDGPRRFSELQQLLGTIAPNVLTQRVRQLEADGLITARPYSRRPLRMQYELTDAGARLRPAIDALRQWAGEHPVRHEPCGTAVELRWWCPTCERVVDPGDDELHHL